MFTNRIHQLIGIFVLLLAGVSADFGIMTADYTLSSIHGSRTIRNYMFVANDIQMTCENAWSTAWWPDRSDVSGDKQGVRYQGLRPTDPDQIEFNINLGHYSECFLRFVPIPRQSYSLVPTAMYKNRDYHIAALDDTDIGECKVVNSFGLNCARSGEKLGIRSIVRCSSRVINV